MDYYDGNTVTGLWNYAQNYAMSDNYYDTTFGPSTPGALNLVSGNTGGGSRSSRPTHGQAVSDAGSVGTLNRQRPGHASTATSTRTTTTAPTAATPRRSRSASMTGKNIGDLLNASGVTWGWFQGGFAPTAHATAPATPSAAPRTRTSAAPRSRTTPAPRAVPVLQVHGQPHAPAAVLRGHDRPDRPGQPPVRPVGLLHDAAGRQHAGRELPQGRRRTRTATPATPTRSTSRHFIVNTINQIEQSKYWSHRDRHHLRRLRRLVRPPGAATSQRLGTTQPTDAGRLTPHGPGSRLGDTTAGAAMARGCRCVVISPVHAGELRQPQPHRPVLGHQVHRGQLARRPSRSAPGPSTQIAGSLDGPGGVLDFQARPHFNPVILNPTTRVR